MKAHRSMAIAATFLLIGLAVAACAPRRHAPDAHMEQNAESYRYDYDDGICSYRYEYNFRSSKDQLEQNGDCRNVPIARYRPQAAITPAYPGPGAAPPVAAPGAQAPVAVAPSVTVGSPRQAPPAAAERAAPPPGESSGGAGTP
jgi:hypothetical protein